MPPSLVFRHDATESEVGLRWKTQVRCVPLGPFHHRQRQQLTVRQTVLFLHLCNQAHSLQTYSLGRVYDKALSSGLVLSRTDKEKLPDVKTGRACSPVSGGRCDPIRRVTLRSSAMGFP